MQINLIRPCTRTPAGGYATRCLQRCCRSHVHMCIHLTSARASACTRTSAPTNVFFTSTTCKHAPQRKPL
jgi:hypothetical protein